jgi:hypothetical protein
MDEAKRFLRYVTPGLVFLTETLILLWIMKPDVTQTILKSYNKDSGLGLAITTLLASGGIGFILSVLHHRLHWCDKIGAVDHRQSIASLRERGVIRLRHRRSGEILPDTVIPDRFQAWTILTGLWHERLDSECCLIKSADPRASSLADFVHSLGTARVAAIAAWIFSLLIMVQTFELSINFLTDSRFIIGNMVAAGFFLLYQNGYKRTGEAAKRIAEQVFEDALTKEKNQTGNKTPIDTYVEL